MDLAILKQLIFEDGYRATVHAVYEMEEDNLTIGDILKSMHNCEFLEDYPNSEPFPSCLILGFNAYGEPIHMVWGYDKQDKEVILITVYRPDPKLWVKYKERRKK